MADEKRYKIRQVQKTDTASNWSRAKNFIPEKGEIVVYQEESQKSSKIKIGNGEDKLESLEFITSESSGGSGGIEEIKNGAGEHSIIINEGYANGKYSIAGGTTDKSMITDLIGSAGSIVSLDPANAQATGSLAFGANTDSIAAGSISVGVENISGCLGYYIWNIDFTNNKIILSKSQNSTLLSSKKAPSNLTWSTGDVVSIFYNTGYYSCSKITAVDKSNGTITVDALPISSFKTPSLLEPLALKPHDNTVYVIEKPKSGEVQLGFAAYARGYGNKALGVMSNAIGYNNIATDTAGFVTGRENTGSFGSLVGGYQNKVLKETGFAAGRRNEVTGNNSAALGADNKINATNGFAVGQENNVYTTTSTAEGFRTQGGPNPEDRELLGISATADKTSAHAEGNRTKAYGLGSHAEGGRGVAEGNYSHVEGYFLEGTTKYYYNEDHESYFFDDQKSPVEIGEYVAVYDISTPSKKIGNARVEGIEQIFLGEEQEYGGHRFVFNFESTNSDLGISYFVKLHINHSKGAGSHTEGAGNKAIHKYSHLEGCGNISGADCQHVSGKWNAPGNYAFIVGNGESDSDRTNAMTVDWNGNAKFTGNVKIYNNKNIATEEHMAEYVSDTISLLSLSSLNSDENSIHVSQEKATEWDAKSNFSGKYSDLIGAPTDLATEEYVDEKVANIDIPEDFFVLNDPIGGIGDHIFLHDFALITQHWPKICIHVFKNETTDCMFFPCEYTYEYNDEAGFECATYYFSNGLTYIAITEGNERVDHYSFDDGYMKLHNPIGTGSFSMNRTGSTGNYSVTLGQNNQATASYSQAEGQSTKAWSDWSHTEGYGTQVGETKNSSWGWASHAEGRDTRVFGDYSHAEGEGSYVNSGISCAHAEGSHTEVYGSNAHAEGNRSVAHDDNTHAEGDATKAQGAASHAEGNQTKTYSAASHAEGYLTQAGPTEEDRSQLGWSSGADRTCAHAEGNKTKALHLASHAEGVSTIARGSASHTEGRGTVATADFQHVQGRFNFLDGNNKAGNYAHIIGGGAKIDSGGSWTEENVNRKNIHTVDWNGNAWYAGKIEANGIILKSSTPNSTKRFLLTINDNGEISTTEYTG